jgi:Putative lumazine-binding
MRWPMVFGLAILLAAAPARAQDPEEAGIRAALEHYLQGHATGDSAHMRLAFHPVARLFWVAADSLAQRTSESYAAGFSGRPADDEAQRHRRIVSIDRAGTAATAKIELDYPNVRFVDYMSLLKINGEWLIVNKIFHRETK